MTIEFAARHQMSNGIRYIKIYNIMKDLFSSPVKGHTPFSHPRLTLLGLTEEIVRKIYESNSQRGKIPADVINKVIRILNQSKIHYVASMPEGKRYSAGLRIEFRGLFDISEIMGTHGEEPIFTDSWVPNERFPTQSHSPFFIFRAKDVRRFIKANLNRWLVLVEEIAKLADHPLAVVDKPKHNILTLQYRPMLVTALHALQLIFDGNAGKHHKVIKDVVRKKPRNDNAEEDDDEDWESDSQVSRSQRRDRTGQEAARIGANFQKSLDEKGVIYLRDDMVNWGHYPPLFQPSYAKRLAVSDTVEYARGFLHKGLIKTSVTTKLELDSLLTKFIIARDQDIDLGTDDETILRTAAQLCVAAYAKEVISHLNQLWTEHYLKPLKEDTKEEKKEKKAEEKRLAAEWKRRASLGGRAKAVHVLNGLYGLCPRIITYLLADKEEEASTDRLIFINARGNSHEPRRKGLNDVSYYKGTVSWHHRAMNCLATDRDYCYERWSNCVWRKKPHAAIINTVTTKLATAKFDMKQFEKEWLPQEAMRFLLVIPKSDSSKFQTFRYSAAQWKESVSDRRDTPYKRYKECEWWRPYFPRPSKHRYFTDVAYTYDADAANTLRNDDALAENRKRASLLSDRLRRYHLAILEGKTLDHERYTAPVVSPFWFVQGDEEPVIGPMDEAIAFYKKMVQLRHEDSEAESTSEEE